MCSASVLVLVLVIVLVIVIVLVLSLCAQPANSQPANSQWPLTSTRDVKLKMNLRLTRDCERELKS